MRGEDQASGTLFSYVDAEARIAANHPLRAMRRLVNAALEGLDGTLLKAWASMKSFQRKDGSGSPPGGGRNGERDFRKEKRSNDTHASTTDPDARLFKKADGQESKLAFLGHALMENRNGLVAGADATLATGTAERDAATQFSNDLPEGATLGADKNYDAEAFVEGLKAKGIVPHVAIQGGLSKTGKRRKTAVPPEVAASDGYAISQRKRKRIEEIFGWGKTVGGLGQLKLRGLEKVKAVFVFACAAYNIVRLPKLLEQTGDVCLAA